MKKKNLKKIIVNLFLSILLIVNVFCPGVSQIVLAGDELSIPASDSPTPHHFPTSDDYPYLTDIPKLPPITDGIYRVSSFAKRPKQLALSQKNGDSNLILQDRLDCEEQKFLIHREHSSGLYTIQLQKTKEFLSLAPDARTPFFSPRRSDFGRIWQKRTQASKVKACFQLSSQEAFVC